MSEMSQRLGEIAQHLPPARIDLLGEQAEVIAGRQRRIEHLLGVTQLALVGKAFSEPERAAEKGSLLAWQAVLAAIAVQQPLARTQLLADHLGGADHPRIAPIDEFHGWKQQQSR